MNATQSKNDPTSFDRDDMNAQHTPGPWREFRDNDSHDVIAPDGTHIAGMEPGPQQDGNARIIAAAPDMLAALEHIAARETQRGDWPDSLTERMVDAAIAKARGRA